MAGGDSYRAFRWCSAATPGTAGMLLQSQGGEISLLPALPTTWAHGYAAGLRARRLHRQSGSGGPCQGRFGTVTQAFPTQAHHTYTLDGSMKPAFAAHS